MCGCRPQVKVDPYRTTTVKRTGPARWHDRDVSARLKGRRREVDRLVVDLRRWGTDVADVRAIAVVGSFARGTPRLGSDLDLVLLCELPGRFGPWLTDVPPLAPARFLHRRAWGPVTELRLRRRSGLHLDVGVAPLSWSTVDPLDPGTARVLRDGVRIVYDPDHLLSVAAAGAGTTRRVR